MPSKANLGCIFSDHLGQNRRALIDLANGQEKTLTFDDIDDLSNAVARGLKRLYISMFYNTLFQLIHNKLWV